ncbi:smc protein [Phaffia rhodozyma]|uniref:Structural maintenance of chromosomes protein n=1 Tax=Phaffia rhodozyma TaxID=264483 RepID=A0A0F7SQD6_PHARH|nr:smc protein [Phaffia rhodozyma]
MSSARRSTRQTGDNSSSVSSHSKPRSSRVKKQTIEKEEESEEKKPKRRSPRPVIVKQEPLAEENKEEESSLTKEAEPDDPVEEEEVEEDVDVDELLEEISDADRESTPQPQSQPRSVRNVTEMSSSTPVKQEPIEFQVSQSDIPSIPRSRQPTNTSQSSSRQSYATGAKAEIPKAELPTPPQKRLIIQKLVLENFKSYAGRQVIGPFHKSFSAIVGPNGSGKSNTIDALLFVFGYRASKMRQGKLGELIHNSEDWPDLTYCKVEVWFKEIIDLPGPDKYKTIPGSNLIVARTAYKDNKSTYSINQGPSSYTEVTTLLKDKGIDLTHKRFLILQGEVESIAQMKPKAQTEHEEGLLEYLEDIIGTSRYKTAIEESLVEMDGLNEIIGGKKNRLGIVVKELNSLKAKKKEAEDYLRDQNELARRQSLLYQYHLFHLRSNIEITQASMARLTEQLTAEREANKDNIAEIEGMENMYNEQNEIYLDVKRNADKIMKELAAQEKKEVQLQEKKKHSVNQQKKLRKAIQEDTHAKSSSATWIENSQEVIDDTRKQIEGLEIKLAAEEREFEEIRDGLKDKTAGFSNQIELKQRELEPWTAKISEKQALIDVAESERKLLREKANGLTEGVVEAEEGLKIIEAGREEKLEMLQALSKKEKILNKQLVQARITLEEINGKEESMRHQASSTRQKADEAKASLAASKGENEMLTGLRKMSEMGRLTGFSGRLGDLGVIDDKYDCAVTTACGGSLNALIVDTVPQGQAVIEQLRRSGHRASIFVLEKLGDRDYSSIDTPEGVPRLFDLIKPKEARFGPAFFKATGNTLVAHDLEQANRIAYGKKRWRVVTLGGDLIDVSGAMSGGGTRVQRGGMSSKFATDRIEPKVLARYEEESEKAQQSLISFQATKRDVLSEVSNLQKQLPELEMNITKVELDIENGKKRMAEAEQRLKELRSRAKPNIGDEQRIKILDKEISSVEEEISSLRQKSSGIEQAIKELQDHILEVGGVKLRTQKSRVDGTKQQIDLAGDKITRAEVEQAKAEKDAEKAQKAITSNTIKLGEIDEQLETLEAELATCAGDMHLIRSTLEEAQEGREALEEDLAALKEELDEKTLAINTFRARELDLTQKHSENEKVLKDSKAKHKHWTDRHQELELQYVEEDDEQDSNAVQDDENAMDQDLEAGAEDESNLTSHPDSLPRKPRTSQLEFETFSDDELKSQDRNILVADVANLEERVNKSKPNLSVLAEYNKRQVEFDQRQADLEEVTANRDLAKKRYEDLRTTRHLEFMTGFTAISSKLKEMYQLITLGGLAELELVDSLDPFSEGVIFSVMPPKKSWKQIANLSGGEKTLSSLALVFALHVYKPTPLYFMDEIDAALDFRNVSIIANYIRERTKSAQFIIISLRSDMFELSHRLVGIYKTSNATKSVAIDNGQLVPNIRAAS